MYAQLRQPPVGQDSISLEQISRMASTRSGSLLLASLGDSQVNSRQHPAITGFSVSNPPMAVNAIRLQEVAELTSTTSKEVTAWTVAAVAAGRSVTEVRQVLEGQDRTHKIHLARAVRQMLRTQ